MLEFIGSLTFLYSTFLNSLALSGHSPCLPFSLLVVLLFHPLCCWIPLVYVSSTNITYVWYLDSVSLFLQILMYSSHLPLWPICIFIIIALNSLSNGCFFLLLNYSLRGDYPLPILQRVLGVPKPASILRRNLLSTLLLLFSH